MNLYLAGMSLRNFQGLGVRGLGFRDLWFRVQGFEIYGLGFRGLGIRRPCYCISELWPKP